MQGNNYNTSENEENTITIPNQNIRQSCIKRSHLGQIKSGLL
jgi:hypothetical protein